MLNHYGNDDCEILEGFLCPLCRDDLKTPEKLTTHVEKFHAEEQDLVKSLKDIFSKAKKKIKLNFDDTVDLAKILDSSLKVNGAGEQQVDVIISTDQTVGVDCSNFSYFDSIRSPRLERYAGETNKLIIRIHKLLSNRPTDPVQRKLHEQKTVPWLDGSSVKLCPNCAKSFNFARRQHHCRLCGTIMCKDCSMFVDYEFASQLANLAQAADDISKTTDDSKPKDNIRCCDHCLRLLTTRKEMQDSRTCRPPITQCYERIKELQKEISPDIPMYFKIIKSLYDGDTVFTLSDASALRAKIGHVAEKIDSLSKAILAIPCPQSSREEALKKAVRLACIAMIKEEMLSIPPLPDEEEIKKIRDRRRMETEQRIERERRLALEAHERYGLGANSSDPAQSSESSAFGSAVTTLDNWSGYQPSAAAAANDPLVEQINIIKAYIKQARQDLRFEEVAILELNLRELQKEFYNRHQQMTQT